MEVKTSKKVKVPQKWVKWDQNGPNLVEIGQNWSKMGQNWVKKANQKYIKLGNQSGFPCGRA
jgi:hypothetical protein